MIKNEIIRSITDRIDIIDVIGDFVKLKKNGSNYSGLCPFHNEKSPSFSVSKTKEIFKCFGCGKSGNAISFVMEHEKFSYIEAMKWFAARYGIEIEEEQVSPEILLQKQSAESLSIINQNAQKFYTAQLLNGEENNIGKQYVEERGFQNDILNTFQIGYAPSNSNLAKQLEEQQFQKEYIVKSGIGVERNGTLQDNYKNRIIFPIHNLSGKIVGFGARILQQNANHTLPKYINTPETELYNKSKILYGIFFARQRIAKEDECILVEGYTDVLALHQAGFTHAVASGGTSLTTEQILLIKKFTNNICIIYDGDAAGIAAASRGVRLCLNQAMSINLLLIPDGHDPDSYIKEYGRQQFSHLLETNKKDFILFELNAKLEESENDIQKKNALVNEMAETIAQIDRLEDFTRQQYYIHQCATMLKIDENKFTQLVNTFIKTKIGKIQKNIPSNEAEVLLQQHDGNKIATQHVPKDLLTSLEIAEQHLVRVLLEYGLLKWNTNKNDETVASYLLHIVDDGNAIEQLDYKQLIQKFSILYKQNLHPDAKTFIYSADENDRLVATKCLHYSQPKEREEWDMNDPFDKDSQEEIDEQNLDVQFKTEKQKQKESFYIQDVLSVEHFFRYRTYQKIRKQLIADLSEKSLSEQDKTIRLKALEQIQKDLLSLAKLMGLQV